MRKRLERHLPTMFSLARDTERVFRAQVAASLVYKGRIVAFGFNRKQTHPLAKKFCRHHDAIWLHAEIDCVKNATKIMDLDTLKKSYMIVSRAKQSDHGWKLGMAKPCEGCQNALLSDYPVKEVWYSTDEGTYELLVS